MRGVGLTLLTCCALACSEPPGVAEGSGVADNHRDDPEVVDDPPRPRAVQPAQDRVLAQARAQVLGGRLPAPVRRELLDSPDPDHRHAARLLQAVAGETPAAVLPRTGERPAVPAVESEVGVQIEVAPRVEPTPEPESPKPDEVEPTPERREPAVELDEPVNWIPKLTALQPGSPAWFWFSTGLVEPEPEPEPETEPVHEVALAERLLEPLPLLLRERPPVAERSSTPGDGPRLVILTSLALEPGPEPNTATLELAGAGSVEVGAQPLGRGRVRLWMLDAGAVPGFVDARPSAPGLEVVEVARRGRSLEIEVELGPGWALRGAKTLENGAKVEFERSVATAPEGSTRDL